MEKTFNCVHLTSKRIFLKTHQALLQTNTKPSLKQIHEKFPSSNVIKICAENVFAKKEKERKERRSYMLKEVSSLLTLAELWCGVVCGVMKGL